MIPEFGHFALILALSLSVLTSVLGLAGAHLNRPTWMAATASTVVGQFVFVALAFVVLAHAFVTDDFSVAYVAHNSNSLLPWPYKVSAVWGAHEGSFLLWTLIMTVWMSAVALKGAALPLRFLARVLGVMGLLNLGFLSFLIFTSNPFDRLVPLVPMDGSDLNPLLQDFGLIVHPPMLYTGYVGLSFFCGLFLALPVVLYQLWRFVAPGLLQRERKYTVPFIVGSSALFYAGGALFYLLLPLIVRFLLSFANEDIEAQLSVGYYVAFCIRLMIAFGVVFQLPMVVIFLTQLDLISSRALIKNFRYAIVITFIGAAILTPPDVVSQTFMALPTLLLYGVSILIAKRIEKRRAEAAANEEE